MADIIVATWEQINAALADTRIQIGLAGPPGVGKTTGVALAMRKISSNPHIPRYVGKIQGHAELSPSEMMGMHVPNEKGFLWEPGPADLAYTLGGGLILDEIHEFSGPCKTYLLGLLDRGIGGTISYVGREFVQQPGYQVAATMNGDPTSGMLDDALLDRFDGWFYVFAPSDEQLMLLDPDLRYLCAALYETAEDRMIGPDITFRMLLGYQRLRRCMPSDVALVGACYGKDELAISFIEALDMLDPEDYENDSPAIPAFGETVPEGTNVLVSEPKTTKKSRMPKLSKPKPAPEPEPEESDEGDEFFEVDEDELDDGD